MATQRDITFDGPRGATVPGSLAVPEDTSSPRPGVIVIHEAFGLNDDIRRIAARFADEGYVALAPDLYVSGPKILCVARAFRDLRRGTGEAFEILDAAREHLVSLDEVDGSRIGAAGFCMGGGFALLYAVKAPLGATAPFYGDVPKRASELEGIPPVCASFGGRDRMFGPKGELLERHLTELGVPHDVKTYADAGHSFMNRHEPGFLTTIGRAGPMKVGFHPEASEDAWRRMLVFFADHLG